MDHFVGINHQSSPVLSSRFSESNPYIPFVGSKSNVMINCTIISSYMIGLLLSVQPCMQCGRAPRKKHDQRRRIYSYEFDRQEKANLSQRFFLPTLPFFFNTWTCSTTQRPEIFTWKFIRDRRVPQ